ncbi:hypothetical protein COV15_02360 [Candidatus Woesearchaeota archaeon CG10_big_fil_rev_8_21_14_0_10_34_12]|nr:MAG: hypothetical protein COV15_02360 [Candidatus Woesearchaeota archaeon CG10_big_fil_rev_8_21_14_0_10_34_12]
MGRFCFLAFLAVLVFGIASVGATSVYVEFNQFDEKVLVKESISLNYESEVEIKLPGDIRSVSANSEYELENGILKVWGKEISVSYITNELIEEIRGDFYFIDKLILGFDAEELNVKIIFDEGYIVNKNDIFPNGFKTETDGRRISILWEFEDIAGDEDVPLFVVFSSVHKGFDNYLVLAVVAVILLTAYFYFRKPKSIGKKNNGKKEIEEHLLESEKAVLNELKNAEKNELWQKQLQIKTGFSKAKLSRVVRNLEARNIIRKIPLGNTNKIRMK